MEMFGSRSIRDVLNQWLAYNKHLLFASSLRGYGIHSPMLYHLITDVIGNKHAYYAFAHLEKIRNELSNNRTRIWKGTNGSARYSSKATVGHVTRQTAMAAHEAQLLFRLVNYFQPRHVLELGGGVGITTAYMGVALYKGQIISVEGNPELARISGNTLHQAGVTNARVHNTSFMEGIAFYIKNYQALDYLVLDGNHTYKATLNYLQTLAPALHENSIVLVHDIHWSRGMEKAWQELCSWPQVRVSADMFGLGMLLFHPQLPVHQLQLRI